MSLRRPGLDSALHRVPAVAALLLCFAVLAQRSAIAASSASDGAANGATESALKPSGETKTSNQQTASASVTLVEFSDFQCPYCARMVPVVDEVIRSYPGKVRLIVKDFPLPSHAGSELAHEACQAAKAQGKYWEMYHLLFANQKRLAEPDLLKYAAQLHLDMSRFKIALKTHRYKAEVEESATEGTALGVTATPTFFLKGRKLEGAQTSDFLKERIQEALELIKPSGTSAGTTIAGSKPEGGVLPNPPVRGSPDAAVVITEFADFQCPFCASARSTLDQLLREYPHKVKLEYRNFPLAFHADSMLAHRAAAAAGEQGKFWEMHDLIFSNQRAMKRDDLFAMARNLNLDMDRFAADLQSEKLLRKISADFEEGKRRGVDGTPTFYIDGQQLVGAASIVQFEGAITHALVAKGIQPDKTPIEVEAGPARGPEHAPVTVFWYSDVTSPLAITADHLIGQLLEAYPKEVRVVFKNRPLEFHRDAMLAHQALVAAAEQGKFWSMHQALLAHQQALSASDITGYAADLGLDTNKFLNDLGSESARDQVQRDVSQAREAGVNGVPVFFVNGTRVDGIQSFSSLKAIVDEQVQKIHLAAVVHE